ncbi:unnamed protein product [Thlaspi arvense]|uniref:Glutaredoxin domain-containing protein n=1 Tax=Thlaspi arvense TaxID=13288 RepID=A0AAU9SBV3_THLAR|nr:unnamed protein product [Thlaspi arvense]
MRLIQAYVQRNLSLSHFKHKHFITNFSLSTANGENKRFIVEESSSNIHKELMFIKTLFYELGASPAIHELDKDPEGREMERALRTLGSSNPTVPAVFVGGSQRHHLVPRRRLA